MAKPGSWIARIDYARRIFDAAAASTIEPSILASTHLNLGVAYGSVADTTTRRSSTTRRSN